MKWNYKTQIITSLDEGELEENLLQLGIREWELVGYSCVPIEMPIDMGGGSIAHTQVLQHIFVLKRPLDMRESMPAPTQRKLAEDTEEEVKEE